MINILQIIEGKINDNPEIKKKNNIIPTAKREPNKKESPLNKEGKKEFQKLPIKKDEIKKEVITPRSYAQAKSDNKRNSPISTPTNLQMKNKEVHSKEKYVSNIKQHFYFTYITI